MDEDDEDASEELEQELLRLQVQLLFQRINTGYVSLDPVQLAETIEAMKAVKFDKRGWPILTTVPERVRSLARIYAMLETEQMEEAAQEIAARSPIHRLLPEATEVNQAVLEECAQQSQFMPVAIGLYAEVIGVVYVCCSIYPVRGEGPKTFPRNQAICVGSLVRITKFMRAVLQLATEGLHREVIHALNRSIADSVVTIRFLIAKDEERLFDQFVLSSLGPERELFGYIQQNIAARDGTVLPIEEQMLRSIADVCAQSGTKVEDVDPKHREWGGNLAQRLEALGERSAYHAMFRLPSHAVHGTWVDLLMNHLRYEEGQYALEMESQRVDQRLLLPTALLVLEAAETYLAKFFGEASELRPLHARIADLRLRIRRFEDAHRDWRDAAWQKRTGQDRTDGDADTSSPPLKE